MKKNSEINARDEDSIWHHVYIPPMKRHIMMKVISRIEHIEQESKMGYGRKDSQLISQEVEMRFKGNSPLFPCPKDTHLVKHKCSWCRVLKLAASTLRVCPSSLHSASKIILF